MEVMVLRKTSVLKTFLLYTSNRASLPNCSRRLFCQKADVSQTSQAKGTAGNMAATFRPNKIDKFLLVWMKKYPSMADVPGYVPDNMMERVRNRARIQLTAYICILSAIAFAGMAFSGKAAVKRGESLKTMNEDFHRSMQEKDKK